MYRNNGGAAGSRQPKKKMQTWTFAIFFYFSKPDHGEGFAPSPFEPL
jgi:hypothetical protein